MSDENPTAPQMAFGEGMRELEAIVSRLESGQLELEESLEAYERGVALLRELTGRLNDAEQRVTVLLGELELAEDQDGGGDGDE